MNEKNLDQLIEWTKEKIRRDTEWLEKDGSAGKQYYSAWHSEVEKDIKICKRILAVLKEKAKSRTNQQIIAEDRLAMAAAGARGMDELMTKDGRRSVSATDRTRKPDWCDEHASPEKIKK